MTAGLPGTRGTIKTEPEDFEVEELPAYLPVGEGEHLFLWIQKRDRDTQEVANDLARALGLSARDVSYAGMKDKRAVTRQFFCVPASAEGKLAGVVLPQAQVLSATRHGNRLRTGHLKGNRFKIRVRKVPDPEAAVAVLERLRHTGLPNYFGSQRFGLSDQNAGQGKLLILGQRLSRAPTRFLRKLFLSSYQSLLFNRALGGRVSDDTLGRALPGDILRRADSGGLFVCEDPGVDQPRVEAFEVSPAGPIFGPKMLAAAQEVKAREDRLLAEEGVALADFRRGKGETEGGRRAYRIPLTDARLDAEGDQLLLSLTLPRGSYATVLLGELFKAGLETGHADRQVEAIDEPE